MLEAVDEIRTLEPRVGTRKLHHRLHLKGMEVGRDSLFTLLRDSGRLVKRKRSFHKTTYSNHSYAVAPNLMRHMVITKPLQALVCDITYLRLPGKACAYLYLLTDSYSRKIVGHHVSRDLTHYSALLALDNAVIGVGKEVTGMVHHSDRGCQYCCHEYLKYLALRGIKPSMTDENHCYQNAVAERVNGILKDEFNLDDVFPSFNAAVAAVRSAVLIYNTIRTHGSLELRTPTSVYADAM